MNLELASAIFVFVASVLLVYQLGRMLEEQWESIIAGVKQGLQSLFAADYDDQQQEDK